MPTKVDVPSRIYYVVELIEECKFNNGFAGRMFYAKCAYNIDSYFTATPPIIDQR